MGLPAFVSSMARGSHENDADGAGRAVFFARVPPFVSSDEIRQLMSAYGSVEHVNLYKKWATARTSKGCGIVTFSDRASASAALEGLNGKFHFPGGEAPMVVEWVNQTQLHDRSKRTDASKMLLAVHHDHAVGASHHVHVPPQHLSMAYPAPPCQHNINSKPTNWNDVALACMATPHNQGSIPHGTKLYDASAGQLHYAMHWRPASMRDQALSHQDISPLSGLHMDAPISLSTLPSSMDDSSQGLLALQVSGVAIGNLPLPAFASHCRQSVIHGNDLTSTCRESSIMKHASTAVVPAAAACAVGSASSSSPWQMQLEDCSITERVASSTSSSCSTRSSSGIQLLGNAALDADTGMGANVEAGLQQLLQIRCHLDKMIRSRCAERSSNAVSAGFVRHPLDVPAAQITAGHVAGAGMPLAADQQMQLLGMAPCSSRATGASCCTTGMAPTALSSASSEFVPLMVLGAGASNGTATPSSAMITWPAAAVGRAVPGLTLGGLPARLDTVNPAVSACRHAAAGLVPDAVFYQQAIQAATMSPAVHGREVSLPLAASCGPGSLAEQLMLLQQQLAL